MKSRFLVNIIILSVLFCGVFAVQAEKIEIIEDTPVLVREAGKKPKKLEMARVGRRFESQGQIGNGKFYQIKVKGKTAFVKASAAKVVGAGSEEKSGNAEAFDAGQLRRLKGFHIEPGFNWNKDVGLAPHLGAYFGIPIGSNMAIDIGGFFSYYPFNEFVKISHFGGAARFSIDVAPMVLSPELGFSLASGGGATTSAFTAGLLVGIALGKKFEIVPGLRMSFSEATAFYAHFTARIRF